MARVGEDTLETMKKAGWYNDWLFSFIKPHLGKDTLEVGAGIGVFTSLVSKITEVWAIDINRRYVFLLTKLSKKNKRIRAGFGDVEKGRYFFKRRKFATVICLNVLEHIENEKKALKNMFLLTKEGGKLILLVPAHKVLTSEFDKELGHFRRYTTSEVNQKLLQTGFGRVSVRYLNWWGAIGWFVFLTILGLKTMPKNEVSIFNHLARFFIGPEQFVRMPFGLSVLAIAQK